jgi:hypothetical protein
VRGRITKRAKTGRGMSESSSGSDNEYTYFISVRNEDGV